MADHYYQYVHEKIPTANDPRSANFDQTFGTFHGGNNQPRLHANYQTLYPTYQNYQHPYAGIQTHVDYTRQPFGGMFSPVAKDFEEDSTEIRQSTTSSPPTKMNSPKKPKTGYIIFSNEMREKIKADLEMKMGGEYRSQDVIKRTGEIWREMSREEKGVWKGKAKIDRERYEIQCKEMGMKPGGKKLSARKGGPKLAKSSYIIFSSEMRDEIKSQLPEGSSVQTLIKKTGEVWRAMSPAQREVWEEKGRQDKARYYRECQEAGLQSSASIVRLSRRSGKDPNAPKRGMSAFLHFSKVMRPKIYEQQANLRSADISKMLGEQWKLLTDEEKAPFREQARIDGQKYRDEMAAYQASANRHLFPHSPTLKPLPQELQSQISQRYQNEPLAQTAPSIFTQKENKDILTFQHQAQMYHHQYSTKEQNHQPIKALLLPQKNLQQQVEPVRFSEQKGIQGENIHEANDHKEDHIEEQLTQHTTKVTETNVVSFPKANTSIECGESNH